MYGVCYYKQKEWDLSTDYFQSTLQLLEEYPELASSNLTSACYNYLALIAYHSEYNLNQSLSYTQKGIEFFRVDGERLSHYFTLLINKAIYLERLNLNENALQAVKDFEQKINSVDVFYNIESSALILMKNMYATIYKNLGLFEEALTHAFDGVKLARIHRQYDYLFSLWTTIGTIYYALGNLEEAKTYYQHALDIEHAITNNKKLAFYYTNLSEMLMKEGKWKKAKEFIDKSVAISSNDPRKDIHVNALIKLGKWHLQQQQYQEALNVFQSAEKIAQQHHLQKEEKIITAALCNCYEHLNDKQKFLDYTTKLYRLTEIT